MKITWILRLPKDLAERIDNELRRRIISEHRVMTRAELIRTLLTEALK